MEIYSAKEKRAPENKVLLCSEVTKTPLMFYVLGQLQHRLPWRRHRINTPKQIYKVVLYDNGEQQLQRRRSKYPQKASAPEQPPRAIREPTSDALDEVYCSNKHERDYRQRRSKCSTDCFAEWKERGNASCIPVCM